MGVGIEVGDDSISLFIGDRTVAEWPIDRVDIEVETDGFHFVVDDDEFIFVTREASEFAEAVGLLEHEVASGQTKTLRRSAAKATQPRNLQSKRIATKKPRRVNIEFGSRTTQLGIAVLVLAALLGVFARPFLALSLMLAGSIGLLVGTGAMLDPIVATKLPDGLTAGQSVLISVVLLLTGMLVLVL
ncbi:MAG: hypothetical protein ACR2ME_06890 [Acidimicrobiia bacterium]